MIPEGKLAEITKWYEEFVHSPDPTSVRRAKLIYLNECRQLYSKEPASLRQQKTFEDYIATEVVVAIEDFRRPKKKYPTV
jgi:hypothetical protein